VYECDNAESDYGAKRKCDSVETSQSIAGWGMCRYTVSYRLPKCHQFMDKSAHGKLSSSSSSVRFINSTAGVYSLQATRARALLVPCFITHNSQAGVR